MKKALSLILALVMCLSLCACDGNAGSNGNPDEIALTLENYSKYLSVEAKMYEPSIFDGGLNVQAVNNGNGIPYDGGSTFYVYKYFLTSLQVKGVSPNFNYNDVSITIRFKGTYKTVDISTSEWDAGNEINSELTVDCNIAGEGSASGEFSGNGGYMLRKMADVEWEVVAISGTVTPAN